MTDFYNTDIKNRAFRRGKRIGEKFREEGKLAYKVMSLRDSDYKMVGVLTTGLDLKVKTLYPPSFRKINKNKLKVLMDGIEYDVIKADRDSNKQYLFFLLHRR